MSYRYSVIIPHYNDEKRLDRLLQTIPLNRKDIQTIVIDDCSPEPTKLAILKKKYPSINWLKTEKNSGAGRARNIGLDLSSGDFLIFADSDDKFTADAFSIFDEALTEKDELCYFLAEAVKESDFSESTRADNINRICLNYYDKQNKKNLDTLRSRHGVPWAKAYKASKIKALNLRFDESLVSNDISFNILAAFQLNKIKVYPIAVYVVYRRHGSLTTTNSLDSFLNRFNVSIQLARRLKEKRIKYRPPAEVFLLRSLEFGPKVFLMTLKKIFSSNLQFQTLREFNPKRWYLHLRHFYHSRKESKK